MLLCFENADDVSSSAMFSKRIMPLDSALTRRMSTSGWFALGSSRLFDIAFYYVSPSWSSTALSSSMMRPSCSIKHAIRLAFWYGARKNALTTLPHIDDRPWYFSGQRTELFNQIAWCVLEFLRDLYRSVDYMRRHTDQAARLLLN